MKEYDGLVFEPLSLKRNKRLNFLRDFSDFWCFGVRVSSLDQEF